MGSNPTTSLEIVNKKKYYSWILYDWANSAYATVVLAGFFPIIFADYYATEFLETVKVDLFAMEIFVFTPQGDVKILTKGATALDFAYLIHTEVGNTCVGAKVDGRMVPLRYELKNGDRVEVLTNPNQKPSRDWVNIAKTGSALTKIRRTIREEERAMAVTLGKELLEKEAEILELKNQIFDEFGKIPKKLKLYNCVGGGSSSFGFWNEFMDYNKNQVEFIGVEAGGPSKSKKHAAPLTYGSKIGILHGAAQYVNQNSEGQIEETESISAGLDYPGVSPIHCFLKDTKRARYTAVSDEDALRAFTIVSKYEKIRPSLEPSHAFAVAISESKKLSKNTVVIVNSCGDAYKDRKILKKKLGVSL